MNIMKKIKRMLIILVLIVISFLIGTLIHVSFTVFNQHNDNLFPVLEKMLQRKVIVAYVEERTPEYFKIKFMCLYDESIEIKELRYNNRLFRPRVNRIITPIKTGEKIKYTTVIFYLTQEKVDNLSSREEITLFYRMISSGEEKSINVIKWKLYDERAYIHLSKNSLNLEEWPFLLIDRENKLVQIRAGKWNINQNIVFPRGYRINVGPDTKLNLLNSSKIISYSPIYFLGIKNKPIIIQSEDKTGQGLVIIGAQDKSILSHVIFKDLSNAQVMAWGISGGINFYESDVEIRNCLFSGNIHGDDMLNIIRSEFYIADTIFSDIKADAIDSDFSKGKILNCRFIDVGNDGIDTSGSQITINQVYMELIRDKAISAGEGSDISIGNLQIKGAEIALTSKDNSRIIGKDVLIQDSKLGFSVFTKKSEYGPGFIDVKNVQVRNIAVLYLLEKKSHLFINNEEMKYTDKNVKNRLYGVDFGTKSIK